MKKKATKKAARRVHAGDRIRGIVRSASPKWGEDDPGVIAFIQPWIDGAGRPQPKELRVVVSMTSIRSRDRAVREWEGSCQALSIVKAWPARKNTMESALATSARTVQPESRLRSMAKQLAKPRLLQDRVLGDLEFARDMGCFTGERRTSKLAYEVMIDADDPDDGDEVIRLVENARRHLLRAERNLPMIRDAAADELLAVCNESWSDGRGPVSRAAFKRELSPNSMHVFPSGVILYLGSGELFADHGVEVRLSEGGEVSEVLVS